VQFFRKNSTYPASKFNILIILISESLEERWL
jgi:hypothetical protein